MDRRAVRFLGYTVVSITTLSLKPCRFPSRVLFVVRAVSEADMDVVCFIFSVRFSSDTTLLCCTYQLRLLDLCDAPEDVLAKVLAHNLAALAVGEVSETSHHAPALGRPAEAGEGAVM